MNIETEIIHKWQIGDDPVFGSGSIKDIQTLCNECSRLREENSRLLHQSRELNAKIGVEHVRTVDAERKNKNLLAEVCRLTMELNAATNGEYTKQDVILEKMHAELVAAEKYIQGVNADWPKGMDDYRDELLARIAATLEPEIYVEEHSKNP